MSPVTDTTRKTLIVPGADAGPATPSPELGEVRPWWRDVIACPACGGHLEQVSRCVKCGIDFRDESGTPVLIAENAVAQVAFSFPQKRSVKTDAERTRYLRY